MIYKGEGIIMNGQYLNRKNLMRIITAVGAVSAVLTLIASAMSGWMIFKLVRYLDSAQKALPKMGKAAELYIEDSTKRKEFSEEEKN